MDFEVYCDESCPEALTDKDAHRFVGIGGVWMPAELRAVFKQNINEIKNKHNIKGELKWNKVSPAYIDLYKEIIDYFFNANYLRFRIILIEAKDVDNVQFNNSDDELSFYKFYYLLLKYWIYDFNNYSVFLDLKQNRFNNRLQELERILDKSNLVSDVVRVQGVPSNQSLGVQLADVLTGLVTAKFNNQTVSVAKNEIIDYVQQYIGGEIVKTPKKEEKFNIFQINLKGGW